MEEYVYFVAKYEDGFTEAVSETYKELKLSPERIIAIGQMYPDLKNNTFLQTQMEIIINNQQEITRFKLTKARLKAYKFFIWVKTE